MEIRLYLAMTKAELGACTGLPPHLGWMACHFSPYDLGLTDLPETLPPGSLLCCDDRIPILRHDAKLVAAQLAQTAEKHQCSAIALDFQQQDCPMTAEVVREVCNCAPCPVAVTPAYAKGNTAAVLLPPQKLWEPLESAVACWPNRELWMEWAPQAVQISVTAAGSKFQAIGPPEPESTDQTDGALCCRYRLHLTQDCAEFLLWDDAETLEQKKALAEKLGIATLVGLYQQFAT